MTVFFRSSGLRFALLAAFLVCCSNGQDSARAANVTDDQYVRELLTAWLVQRDLPDLQRRFAADFVLPAELRDPAAWPESVRSLPDRERALRFPFACANAPAHCSKLTDCIADASHRNGHFEIETVKIDEAMIHENPHLRSRAGHDVLSVSFVLRGCNIGTSLLLDKNEERRIVMVFYIAG